MNWIVVFLGGGIGSLMRYATGLLVAKWYSAVFPLATLIANITASLILGITVALLRHKVQHHDYWYAFIVIGICGGYSTFSSFARENVDLFEKGHYTIAVFNILISLLLCISAVYLGKRAI